MDINSSGFGDVNSCSYLTQIFMDGQRSMRRDLFKGFGGCRSRTKNIMYCSGPTQKPENGRIVNTGTDIGSFISKIIILKNQISSCYGRKVNVFTGVVMAVHVLEEI